MARNGPVALVLALLLALVGVALAGDEAAARRAIKSARESAEGDRPELAETYVTQARRYMEGLPAATVKQMEDELVVIEARVSERKRLRELASQESVVRRSIKSARDNVESDVSFRPEQAMNSLQQARRGMEKLPPEMVKQMEEEIRAIEGLISERRRAQDREVALRAIERSILRGSESDLERWGHRTLGSLALVKKYEEELQKYYGFENAYALTAEDKAAHQKHLKEFKTKCEAHEVETRFWLADDRCERVENASQWSDEFLAAAKAEVDEHLKAGNVPQSDPRIAKIKARLQAAFAAKQSEMEADAREATIRRVTDDWTSLKNRFQRDCPAWDAQLGNDYPVWVQKKEHGLEKAAKRWATAGELMDDDDYKSAVNFFKDDPVTVKVMTEVQTWRREAADRLFTKAAELVDEAEKHAGDSDLRPALEALVAELERKAPEATSGTATLARARAALARAGGTPSTGGGGEPGAPGQSRGGMASGEMGIIAFIFGLLCCFGLLAVGGVGGFFAYKHMSAAKAGTPPGAPPAA